MANRETKWRITGRAVVGAAVCMMVAVAIGIAVFDRQFEIIRPSPRIGHERVAPADTRMRIVFSPPLAKDYMASQYLLASRDLPASGFLERHDGLLPVLLDASLPYEVALLFSPDLHAGEVHTTIFVNDKRLAPLVIQGVERADIPGRTSYVDWAVDTLRPKGRGYLSMAGTMSMLPQARRVVQQKWDEAAVRSPLLPSEGGHLIEAIFDNRDGGSCAAMLSLLAANGTPTQRLMKPDVMDAFVTVSQARAHADLTDDGGLAVHAEVQFREGITGLMLEGFTDSFELLVGHLEMMFDTEIPGSAALDGSRFVADYILSDPSVLWRTYEVEESSN